MDFVHLHVHSHYSLLDGGCRPQDLVDAAQSFGMKSIAMTDHGNMFGAVEFHDAAVSAGVKPILGIEAYISPTHRADRTTGGIDTSAYHLLLLAMNTAGWRNLLKLSSRSYTEGFYYKPRIDRELLEEFNEGLICCTACLGGEVPTALIAGDLRKARNIAGEYLDIFGRDRLFVEIQKQGYEEQEKVNPALVQLAKDLGVKCVGTNDVHFLRREDKRAHEILTCISTGKVLSDETRMQYSPELYLKSAEEMHATLREWPETIENTLHVAGMCDCRLDFSGKHAPVFHPPNGERPEDYLRKLARDGLRRRFGGTEPPAEYALRLEWELRVIEEKGYSSYLLIINDCVQFARRNSIPAAPRGSGVATLLGYALGIADVDPLRYGLLFERFTDPQREEDPDIDLDICQEGRGKVIDYVREKYGHVAQIITYGTLKARAAIRDVGRVMDIPLPEVDAIAKLVPEGPGVTLAGAIEKDRDLAGMYESDSRVRELIDHGRTLEGLVRHSGVHAAGVVVCDKPLENYLPLCKQSNSDETITQWDGPTCDKMGMMKMDFLGLRTLTIIQHARELVRKRSGHDIDPEELALDDQEVLALFREGATDGVFQFESEGMKGVLVQMKPNRIEDLIAANAMYRPGPMKLIPTYCNRKNGKEPVPGIHPLVDDILEETYGVMVYQEQVMQVLNRLGKIPLSRALTGIKAISKKKREVLTAEQPSFLQGAGDNGIDEQEARRLFDLILEFAGYGFNKAHSTRYAIVAYQTAYFKRHHPREFIAATLTYERDDRDKVVQYMGEAGRLGVTIAAPDVNTSDVGFTVDGDLVRFGLAAIKGVGEKAVNAIVDARDRVGAFTDLFHFCRSVDLGAVNRSTIEALIRCGALDRLDGGHRAALIAAIDGAVQSGHRSAADRNRGQIALFSEEEAAKTTRLPDVPVWPREQLLAAEKETLGFYVTSHPLEEHKLVVTGLNRPRRFTLAQVEKCSDSMYVSCGCMISQVRTVITRRGKSAGKKMAMVTLEDLSGRCEAVLFAEAYEKYGHEVNVDALVYITGTILRRNERPSIGIDTVLPIKSAIETATAGLVVRMPCDRDADDVIGRLREVLGRHSGPCRLSIHLFPPDEPDTLVVIEPSTRWWVKPSAGLVSDLETVLGFGNLLLQPKTQRQVRDRRDKSGRRARAR